MKKTKFSDRIGLRDPIHSRRTLSWRLSHFVSRLSIHIQPIARQVVATVDIPFCRNGARSRNPCATPNFSGLFNAFGVSLAHMSVWRDVQERAESLCQRRPRPPMRVLGLDGVYGR